MGYQYKPGDRVRVIDCFEEGHDYRMQSQDCGVIVKRTFKAREPFKGKIVTIAGYVFRRYIIEETPNNVLWTDEMFTGRERSLSCKSLL
jgi:hypothetical protein